MIDDKNQIIRSMRSYTEDDCIGDDPTTGKKCVKKPKRPLANGIGGNGLSNLGSNIKDLFRKKNRPSSRAKRLRS